MERIPDLAAQGSLFLIPPHPGIVALAGLSVGPCDLSMVLRFGAHTLGFLGAGLGPRKLA